MTKYSADIVVGANYGDEGKGLTTDYLVAPYGRDAIVVRHNGGAQAGHTVQLEDGTRHVFKHFGSGTLAGAATYLSHFFVANPILFMREWDKLEKIGVMPRVYIDAMCAVSTPYDMMINQVIEDMRGSTRHGSVGVGFGETVGRNLRPEYALYVDDLADRNRLNAILRRIRGEWVPQRLAKLGVPVISAEWQTRFSSEGLMEHFMQDCDTFLSRVTLAAPQLLQNYAHICFEGAQGLLLDQARGAFPHVTRSYTGLRNALDVALEAGIGQLNVYYATRTYMTRHGAGPLLHECAAPPYDGIVDATNVPNAYQGALRFALPDINQFLAAVRDDLSDAPATLDVRRHIAVSCMDQVGARLRYIHDGKTCDGTPEAYAETLRRLTGAGGLLTSYGPTRAGMVRSMPKTQASSGRISFLSAGISSSTISSPSIAI